MKIKTFTLLVLLSFVIALVSNAQSYRAPQDTAKTKRAPNESLTKDSLSTRLLKADSRLLGCAVKAADMLKDTTKFDNKKGIPLEQLFSDDDLRYIADQGVSGAVALFDLINQNLPKGESIAFKTDSLEKIITPNNPLVLKNLRAMISDKPATITEPQWKENVYQAYVARDYGTQLFNTITITSATREIRESPTLEIKDFDGSPVTLRRILSRNKTEQAAVADFREHTFPNNRISKENANENYRRALFELMGLQENDISRHPESKRLLADLTNDLQRGQESNVLFALKSSHFFDANVPGNLGPVLLTESKVINNSEIAANAQSKAMELMMLVSLHYGERDAVKLFRQLINGNGPVPARQTNEFTPKRLNELTAHGVEKFKSLGFQQNKTQNMTNADLVLVAVSSPAVPVQIKSNGYLAIQAVGQSIINNYSTTEETTIIRNTILFNPRISLNSRHTEYRTAYDVIDYVPEIQNGQFFDQRGSRVTQNGVELRLETDLYFSNPEKISKKGVKPVVYPEFGILAGIGTRSVGYDASTTNGVFGPVPQFQSRYQNWGAHLGLNVGPVMLGTDATLLSTPTQSDPLKSFFDLSQSMTYFRYEILTHILYLGFRKDYSFTVDLDLVGESNNEGFGDLTTTQGSDYQIKSAKWNQDYNQIHAGGVYNQQLATYLLDNGYVKASYTSSNYAALNLGIQKSNLKLTGTAGLYDIHTRTGNQLADNLIRNTWRGNLFGAIGLTYNFVSKSTTSKHVKKDTYTSTDTKHNIQETDSGEETRTTGPRNHAIITNNK